MQKKSGFNELHKVFMETLYFYFLQYFSQRVSLFLPNELCQCKDAVAKFSKPISAEICFSLVVPSNTEQVKKNSYET